MSELELLQRRFDRERAARREAEKLLEHKSRELFDANQQLQSLAERTRSIVETAAEGILTYDEEGTIDSINRSARKIFAVDDGSTLNIDELFQLSNAAAALFADELVTESDPQSTPASVEVTGVRSSGETFVAEVSVSSCTVGDTRTYTALVRDLSRRKKLEAQLRQAKKMESVGQLAAGIAHEINTPIQFIGDNIQFLQGAFDDLGTLLDLFQKLTEAVKAEAVPEGLMEEIETQSELADLPFLCEEFPGAIEQSLDGIERVATIVRAMKEFSQPTSEGKTSVDINRVIENTLAVSGNLYRDVATIRTSLDSRIPSVPMIEAKINQTILNIIANAAEAIASSERNGAGLIEITSNINSDELEVIVRDNGAGIPAEIQDRVFDPFFTTKEVGQGTGQGLAFVYDVVVNKHGGTVLVESTEDVGTTFMLRIPFTHNDNSRSERPEHASATG